MTAILFLAFLSLTATALIALIARYGNRRAAFGLLAGLLIWFAYAGLMGYFGVIRKATSRPPGVVFLVTPIAVALVFFIVRSSLRPRFALAFPLWLLIGAQTFRVIVELFLHQLWLDGLIPRMLTFSGANGDIFIGASAPLAAWLSTRGRTGIKLAFAWNVLGLLALANVVVRAVLTAPGPLHAIHSETPNLMMGTFPFLFIPGFFVPLAVVLHTLSIQNILSRLRTR